MRARDMIEPAAVAAKGHPTGEPGGVTGHEVAVSQAISLRRIADALEGSIDTGRAKELGFEFGQNMGAGLEQLMFSVGQQFKRGSDVG